MCRGDLNARFCGDYRKLLSQNAILFIFKYTPFHLLHTFTPFYLFIILLFHFIYYSTYSDIQFVFRTKDITLFQYLCYLSNIGNVIIFLNTEQRLTTKLLIILINYIRKKIIQIKQLLLRLFSGRYSPSLTAKGTAHIHTYSSILRRVARSK